jgi:hypothetical protein
MVLLTPLAAVWAAWLFIAWRRQRAEKRRLGEQLNTQHRLHKLSANHDHRPLP